jgi:hypothetical protein
MKIELRTRMLPDRSTVDSAVLISESEHESLIIDRLFGTHVIDTDGLIARRQVEVRLADGFREHYLYVVPKGQEK